MSKSDSQIAKFLDEGTEAEKLDVHVSYEIIKLFSEGLYKSPHKAIEELVANSYDAGAQNVFVSIPSSDEPTSSLWVIDDGSGMDSAGFHALWSVARSQKATAQQKKGQRAVIGQFGIGKLAAYVLAWRLTHISKHDGHYRFTSMDFHDVSTHPLGAKEPLSLELREVDEAGAKNLLAEVEKRDATAWARLFGKGAAKTWTAAALSDFRDLAAKLKEGTLTWVLRSGLPLTTDFKIFVQGTQLESAQEDRKPLATLRVGGKEDGAAKELGLATTADGVKIEGLGVVTGEARLYEQPLTLAKAAVVYHRAHGFFVRVRSRVINLEDELFGLEALNHAVWSRFVMTIDAEGLREYLLSSREGVRDVPGVETLRQYLRLTFNAMRAKYDGEQAKLLAELDVAQLLKEAPTSLVTEPLTRAVQLELSDETQSLQYIRTPADLTKEESGDLFKKFSAEVKEQPFKKSRLKSLGPYGKAVQYDVETQELLINDEHPFMAKVLAHSKNDVPSMLFGSSEVMTDALLRGIGLDQGAIAEFFEQREKLLRLLAGDHAPIAADAIRFLNAATEEPTGMERAVGTAFEVLGFKYDPRGGSKGGTDGVLNAELGRQGGKVADFRIVFDAKTTGSKRIQAGKIDFASLNRFKGTEKAQFAFAIGRAFDGEKNPKSKLNEHAVAEEVTVMLIDHLLRLVRLHVQYGLTFTQIRDLFETAYSVPDVETYLDKLEKEVSKSDAQVPVLELLEALEELKKDKLAVPNINAARAKHNSLAAFPPEKLTRVLQAVQSIAPKDWLDLDGKGNVTLHQSPKEIVVVVNRTLSGMLDRKT